ncbi:S-layer homology domain-containing protein [Rossellomorea vietnamensis]|uniref:S-layer homology domain-containing protein n=1 Tax=Rossellomorea vietnamensis TaxID=218284 RepID=A0A5D4LYU6_9BACI|nr:S-layer homology domain-containing protein [Rossellomorea vietnamensis]TYR94874.1 S-layer homology domain-containing protein [Rossellomorea vietnamensis]
MANQPKSYRKFLAGSVTAALVASAVAPVASAATFTDLPNDAHKDNILKAVEWELVNGYDDNTFRPYQEISRGQVVKIIARYLGDDIVTDGTEQFADVVGTGDTELLDAALKVRAAGVFTGSKGNLKYTDTITREEMASVLVRLFSHLQDKEDEESKVTDNDEAYPVHADNIDILSEWGITTETEFNPKGDVVRAQFVTFMVRAIESMEEVVTPEIPEVVGATALNLTTVEVELSSEVESVTAENFAIEGATVNSATLSEDKTVVTLDVTGLEYGFDYEVAVTGVLVDGEEYDLGSYEFAAPAVADLWNLEVTSKEDVIIANGADNTEVTFNLIDTATGEIDTNADDVVLALSTTYGNLSHQRVTVQDGTATVILSSEFSVKDLEAKIDAQIIEAAGDYKYLIGEVVGAHTIKFTPAEASDVVDETPLSVVDAESNQADRVVAYFDKEVNLSDVVKTNASGDLLYTIDGSTREYTKAELTASQFAIASQVIVNGLKISQGTDVKEIRGVRAVEGNAKALEIILEKEDVLEDNKQVTVAAKIFTSNVTNAVFNLTDARVPELTSVAAEGMNVVKAKFSEAVDAATFKIDGRFNSDSFDISFGEFNVVTGEDHRNIATLKLNDNYDEDRTVDSAENNKTLAGYFTAGSHSLQVSNLKDFAALSDRNNVGTTQTLAFNVTEDTSKPSAIVDVESPEQFRVTFSKNLKETVVSSDVALQVYDSEAKKWVSVGEYFDQDLSELLDVTTYGDELVVELTKDWTEIYKTATTNENYYNDDFRIHIAKGTIANESNGLSNDEINLDLNYAGSALNTPDTVSPIISQIDEASVNGEFIVTMTEPVKLAGSTEVPTLNQDQTKLPETSVQFIGKDKDGKTVTFDGTVAGYSESNGADTKFYVKWNAADKTPQTVVDAGGSNDWTLVVKSLSDDVGNTAATVTKDFTIAKTPAATPSEVDFFIETVEGALDVDTNNADDSVTITFSEGVKHRGEQHDATKVSQYQLNGQSLPVGSSVAVEDNDTEEGFETVVITLPDGTLNTGSNVITVNKNLTSYDDSVLIKEYEKTFEVASN